MSIERSGALPSMFGSEAAPSTLKPTEPTTGAEPRPWVQESRSLLRDTVLRSTDSLVSEKPWRSVTISQVAKAAGVSRQTIYNEFGTRSDLARAYAAWAGDQLLDEVERCVADHRGDLTAALTAAFAVFLEKGADHPLIRSLGDRTGSDDLVSALATPEGAPIVNGATARLMLIIGTTWPTLPPDLVAIVAEALVRMAISHLLMPTSTPEVAASQLAVLVTPLIKVIETTHLA